MSEVNYFPCQKQMYGPGYSANLNGQVYSWDKVLCPEDSTKPSPSPGEQTNQEAWVREVNNMS